MQIRNIMRRKEKEGQSLFVSNSGMERGRG